MDFWLCILWKLNGINAIAYVVIPLSICSRHNEIKYQIEQHPSYTRYDNTYTPFEVLS